MLSDQEQILTTAGFSMEPLLHNGDRVRLKPVERTEIIPGDIVAFEDDYGEPVVHRAKMITPQLVTQGDNNLKPDPLLSPDAVLAKIIDVERNGETFVPEQGKNGLKIFHRHQKRAKLFKLRERFGRFICHLLPRKIGEDQLQTVEYGSTTVYYWRDYVIGSYWKGEWLFFWWPAAFFIRRPRRVRLIPLAELLGASAAGHGAEALANLSPGKLHKCCEFGRKFGFAPFLYHALSEVLPLDLKEQFQREYYARCAREIPNRQAMEFIASKLSEREIPFIWLKGGFLAYNVYPSACTRHRRDLDLLIPRKDAEAVFELLISNGWVPRERDMRRKRSLFYRHHLPSLSHKNFPVLELHWHIFKDISQPPSKLWEYAHPTGNGSEYHFLPEVHYFLAIYNCYVDAWEYALRSMLDMSLLQKRFSIDPELLQKLNSDFNLELDLGLVYAAFPEFFSEEEKLFTSKFPPDVIVAIRSLAVNEQRNSVRSPLEEDFGNRFVAALMRSYKKIPLKWRKYFYLRGRVSKRDRRLLGKKLPRFRDLRVEARQSHGRF